jgi:hypothetical protein
VFYDVSQATVTSRVRNALSNYRDSMKPVEDVYRYLAGYSVADLVTLGFSNADAQDIKTAVADAHQEVVMHTGGGLGTYAANYDFSAAQNRVMGP